jgi:hypothetical protein
MSACNGLVYSFLFLFSFNFLAQLSRSCLCVFLLCNSDLFFRLNDDRLLEMFVILLSN